MPPYKGIRKEANPSYRLTPTDRRIVAALYYMGLWTPTWIAREFGVTRKTVYNCKESHADLQDLCPWLTPNVQIPCELPLPA